jgi:predicted CXXCH cytochrome family protein
MIGSAHPGNANDMPEFVFNCKTCHDGSLGKEIGSPVDHKVNVDYRPNKDFKILSDRRIVLIQGKVTCVSCHNPYNLTSAKLVKDNTSSKLCLTCHNR